jgi:hypothetical protein
MANHGGESINPTRVDTLKVPGASLYCEVWGSGPVLLLIAGGAADAGVFAALPNLWHTALHRCRRGASRAVLGNTYVRGAARTSVQGAHQLLEEEEVQRVM